MSCLKVKRMKWKRKKECILFQSCKYSSSIYFSGEILNSPKLTKLMIKFHVSYSYSEIVNEI